MIHTLKTLREDEIRYRERGCFELAVQRQQQADIVEAGLAFDDHVCSFVDHGTLGDVRHGVTANGLVGFRLPSGLLWLLAPDMMSELWSILTFELALTPDQLFAAAIVLDRHREKGGAF